MTTTDKIFIATNIYLICVAIQWHGHYLKGEVSNWDVIVIIGLSILISYLATK